MKKKRSEQFVGRFSAKVRKYILIEYNLVYNKIYSDMQITKEVRTLMSEYYWGGNNIPFTAGQIVDYVRSKYKDE
tara:strand:- start:12456 stop:12680 length:225 start_codon:yes stop_codon:yes gene_type:complete